MTAAQGKNDVLERWKARALSEEMELPSGAKVKLRMPNVEDFMLSGAIPLPVIKKLQARNEAIIASGDGDDAQIPDLTQEELTFAVMLDRTNVARSVVELDGQAVTLTPDDAALIPREDFDFIKDYIERTQAPKAAVAEEAST